MFILTLYEERILWFEIKNVFSYFHIFTEPGISRKVACKLFILQPSCKKDCRFG